VVARSLRCSRTASRRLATAVCSAHRGWEVSPIRRPSAWAISTSKPGRSLRHLPRCKHDRRLRYPPRFNSRSHARRPAHTTSPRHSTRSPDGRNADTKRYQLGYAAVLRIERVFRGFLGTFGERQTVAALDVRRAGTCKPAVFTAPPSHPAPSPWARSA
jgi:hypothetical protein